MSVIDGLKQNIRALPKDTFEVITTPYELRQRKEFQVDKIYQIRKGNFAGYFWYDPTDSSTADNLGTVIVATGGQRLKRFIPAGSPVYAKWFGAIGNGTTDDTVALQKAIDTVIKNPNLPRQIWLDRGSYLISDSLIAMNWDGAEYQFVDFELVGYSKQKTGYGNIVTSIVGTSALNNKFFLGIQRGRAVRIRNISFTGNYTKATTFTIQDIVRNPRSTWNQTGISNSAQSPHCAINIDPFSATVPSDGGYPGLTANYRGTLYGGSSGLDIENCYIFGFSVGIGMSITGLLPNAEICHIVGTQFAYCITALAVGEDQAKQNFFNDIQVWTPVHTVIDCLNYGNGTGCPPMVNGMNIAGGNLGVYQLINAEAGRNPFFANQIYAESIFKIGTIKPIDFIPNVQAHFNSCDFNFLPPDYNVPTADFIINGPAKFTGGRLFYLGNATPKWRLKLTNPQSPVTFDGTAMDVPIVSFPRVGTNSNGYIRPVFKNITLSKYAGNIQYNKDIDNLPPHALYKVPVGNMKISWSENSGNVKHYFDYKETAPDDIVSLGAVSVTVNSNGTASFTASAAQLKLIRLNDVIMSDASKGWSLIQTPDYTGAPYLIPAASFVDNAPCLGVIIDITGTTVTTQGCNVNIPVGTTAAVPLYVNYIRFASVPVSCTITAASATLTAVEYHNTDLGTLTVQVGDRLEHPFIPKGSYVTATGAGTITMSDVAAATDTHASIINGDPFIVVRANVSPDEAKAFYTTSSNFFKGAIWKNSVQPGGTTERWRDFIIQRNSFSNSSAHPLLYKVWTEGIDVVSIANIKYRYAPDPNTMFFITDATKEGFFRYDPTDTTTAGDDVNVIVGSFNSNRFKRVSFSAALETLDSVTDNGNTTTNNITVGNVTANAATIVTLPATGNKADKIVVRTNGITALKVIDNVFPDVLSASVSTSDATVTTLANIPTAAGFVFEVDATIKVNNDVGDKFAVYKRQFRVWDNGGTSTLLGSAVTIGTDYEDGTLTACDVSVDVSGANCRIRVTGIAATILYWDTKYIIRSIPIPAS